MNVTAWSAMADDPARNTCSPNLLALRSYLIAAYGGVQLGCYSERNIRGGEKPSAHSHGAALDWRYEDPGPGRPAALAVAEWVIAHHELLGVQAIHDYVGARIWHSDRQAWKPAARKATGGYVDPNMGHAWAQWFHFETTLAAWADARTIPNRLDQEDETMPPKLIKHGKYNAVYYCQNGYKLWLKNVRNVNAVAIAEKRLGIAVETVGEAECVSYGPILGPIPAGHGSHGEVIA